MKFKSNLVLSFITVVCLMVFTFSESIVNAAGLNSTDSITPCAISRCPIYGARHLSSTKRLLYKVYIDGEASMSLFSRHTCECGSEIYIDGYPYQGFVGRYFYEYYGHGLDASNSTYLKVKSYKVFEEYTKGYLIDWDF